MPIHGRCTVQKSNFRYLRDTVRAAHTLGLDSISFLAADVTSEAFNRPLGWPRERQASIALDDSDVVGLDLEISTLISDCRQEIESGFISETPEKLRRIVTHYQAHLRHVQPVAPHCNAPWVSAVVEADGTVRPCFFHRPIGNIHEANLRDVLNGEPAMKFRRELDVARNPVCQKCVCSLYLAEEEAEPLRNTRSLRKLEE
jgi:MoaA/NifB/PqqE/SkfB family radical SAM enzyme